MTDFLKENNVRLLWEVLMDEDILRSKPKEFIEYILRIFQKNLVPFYENERKITQQNLVFFNKKYISFMMDMILQVDLNSKNTNKPQNPQKKDLITYEEIQEERKSVFEREFNKKQEEFKQAVTLPTPPVPQFGDKLEEEKPPISELERRIQQTVKERNFDLLSTNHNIKNASDWLNPQETSVKKEKGISNSMENKIKYIKIEGPLIKENIIQPISLDGLETRESKHIQWSENLEESYYIPDIETNKKIPIDSIFSKLKTIPSLKREENIKDTNYLLKDVRIQQLEEEVQSLYQKIDDIHLTMEEIKKMITIDKVNIES